jgi:N-methylhydantoinase B
MDYSERWMRAEIEAIPDGVYEFTDYMEDDGVVPEPVKLHVTVTVEGDRLIVDWTGSSPQVRGPFNCVPSGSLAAACYAVRAVTDPEIPTNAGCFRPITLELPKGSIVNPLEPAPVNSRTATIKRITGCILGALKEVLPERVPADSSGELVVLAFGGRHDGQPYVTGELIAGGSGAGPHSDGVDVIETDVTNCMNLPVEAMEMDAPIRVHRLELRQDSGGAGTQRGGLGLVKEYEVLDGEISFTYRGERHFFTPQGARGGGEGAKARAVITRRDGQEEIIPSKTMTTLKPGDRVLIETAGGGGNGPPASRSRVALEADLADGKIALKV